MFVLYFFNVHLSDFDFASETSPTSSQRPKLQRSQSLTTMGKTMENKNGEIHLYEKKHMKATSLLVDVFISIWSFHSCLYWGDGVRDWMVKGLTSN